VTIRAPTPLEEPTLSHRALFLAGLFLATLATLLLELINTRLLSVVTWYHLSFFAVSTAMFGMAAGAIRVYQGGAAFEGESARRALASWSTALAVAIPLSHILVLCVPIHLGTSAITISGLVVTTLAIATSTRSTWPARLSAACSCCRC
jgi:hypothetical protein